MFCRAASFFLVQIMIFLVNYKVLLKHLNTRIAFQWLRMCGFQVCYDGIVGRNVNQLIRLQAKLRAAKLINNNT